MTDPPVRDRLVTAAFELFDERGYEHTTVEEIAERAGVGRTSFFRHYRSKEDVIFPDHSELLELITRRLDTSTEATAIVAVCEAVRLVLLRYLAEGDRARRRYRLICRVPALRDREIASVAPYQRLFREFIATWMGRSDAAALRSELMAAAVVSAHNHVLRRWLRGDSADPLIEVDEAMNQVISLFSVDIETRSATQAQHTRKDEFGAEATTVIVLSSSQGLDEVVPAVRRALHAHRLGQGVAG